MSVQSLVLFFLASLALALTPGPDILTVITRSVTQGKGAGLVATLGFATGLIVHTTAAALGLSLVIKGMPGVFWGIRIAGGVYLLYLAARMAMEKDPVAIDTTGQGGQGERWALDRIYGQSILMNVLNPMVTLFFLAFLPQFVSRESRIALGVQFVILGGLFAVATLVGFGGCALVASVLTRWLRKKPGTGRGLRLATAAMFVVIAVRLALP
jgi:threonine/homoserine/homoserine lactone efflux protein